MRCGAQEVRDLLADHWLETVETDLKYTVLLVCDEVPDLLESDDAADASTSTNEMPFLPETTDSYSLRARLSDGDSIPRCDATLLRVPVSKREMDKEKKLVKKAIKKKIKKFKKGSEGASLYRCACDRTGGGFDRHTVFRAGGAQLTADFYVLDADELKVHLPMIPFEDEAAAANFVTTLPLLDGETRSKDQMLLALDCEMCRTTKGVELTRITLVDSKEQVRVPALFRLQQHSS